MSEGGSGMREGESKEMAGIQSKDAVRDKGKRAGRFGRAIRRRAVGAPSRTRLRPAALALAALAALALGAPEQAAAQTTVWSATLTVKSSSGVLGCSNGFTGSHCTANLSDDDFTHDSTDYAITTLWVRPSGRLEVILDTDLTTATQALTLNLGGTAFAFENADGEGAAFRSWNNSGLSWTVGDTVSATLTAATTADTTAPAFASAAANGASLVITFDEDLAAAASLANSAFTVKKTASGGSEATVALSTTVSPVISGTTVTLTLGTALVSTDGSVKVTYTKPTTGSANKLVDAAGNETASFTDQTVTNNTPAVTSGTTCGAADLAGRTSIWTATLTVETVTLGDSFVIAYGFDGTFGDLSDKTFTIGPNDYEIDEVKVLRSTNRGNLDFSLKNANLTTAEKTALRIHVCNVAYDFSAATGPSGTHSYQWAAGLNWSSETSRTLHLSLPTITVPGAPQNLMVMAGDEDVALSWSAPTSNGGAAIIRYEYRHAAGTTVPTSTSWTNVDDSIDLGTSTSDETGVTITTLTNATQYAFEVRAVNSVGDGPKAGPVTATPTAGACLTPNFNTRRNIWAGNVMVAAIQSGGSTSAYGFGSGVGTLDDKTFRVGSNSHEIDAVAVASTGTDVGDISFSLKDANLTTAEKAALRLHVCGANQYDFSAATLVSASHDYKWNASLDWSSFTSRALHLSLPANNAATGTPTISGDAAVDEMLTANNGTIADADGLPATFTYQWILVDGASETNISGATSSTYTPVASDEGKKIKVRVSFTDNLSGEESRTSEAYPATNTVASGTTCNTPDLAGRTSIWTGIVTVGSITIQLSSTDYGWFQIGGLSIGSLDNKTFNYGPNTYEIDAVSTNRQGIDDGDLRFGLKSADLTTTQKTALRLHLCDTAYDFSTARGPNSQHDYGWTDNLNWSFVTSRTLHLSVPTPALPGAPENFRAVASNTRVTLRWACAHQRRGVHHEIPVPPCGGVDRAGQRGLERHPRRQGCRHQHRRRNEVHHQ